MTLLANNETLTNYVWSEYQVDPIQLIGQTARIEVTYIPEATRGGKRTAQQFIYSGVIREVVESRGQARIDSTETGEDAADGSRFENYGTTRIYMDNQRIEFGERDHVVITILNRS